MGEGASLQNRRRAIWSGFILESLLYLHIFSTSYDLTRHHWPDIWGVPFGRTPCLLISGPDAHQASLVPVMEGDISRTDNVRDQMGLCGWRTQSWKVFFYFIALEIRRKAAFASNVKAFCRWIFYWRWIDANLNLSSRLWKTKLNDWPSFPWQLQWAEYFASCPDTWTDSFWGKREVNPEKGWSPGRILTPSTTLLGQRF